jgi:hypothetical protein
MVARLSGLRAGIPLSHEDSWHSLLLEAVPTPVPTVRLQRSGELKLTMTENRARDLLPSSIKPQQITQSRIATITVHHIQEPHKARGLHRSENFTHTVAPNRRRPEFITYGLLRQLCAEVVCCYFS